VGAAYDLFGDGKTALKVALGRYAIRNVGAAVDIPATQQQAASTTRTWNDSFYGAGDPRTGNYVPDCDLRNSAVNGECAAWNDLTFGQIRAGSTRRAEDALTGFNLQNYNWQGSVTVQRQLRPNMGLSVGYFRTWYGNFLATDNQAVTPANYNSYCVTSPTDSRLPYSGQQICGLYDVTPTLFGRVDNVITQASRYGKETDVFNGVDITLNMRLRQGAQFQGSLSTGKTVTDTCDFNNLPQVQPLTVRGVAAQAPTNLVYPRVPGFCHISQPWTGNTGFGFNVVYPLPWDIQTSALYQNKPGYPISATYVASNAEIRSSLGRNLAACPSQTAATCNQNVTVELMAPGTVFGDRITQLDLRFSRFFPLGKTRLQGNFDIYNISNSNTVLNEQTRYQTANNLWRNAVQIMGGRLLKFSAQLTF